MQECLGVMAICLGPHVPVGSWEGRALVSHLSGSSGARVSEGVPGGRLPQPPAQGPSASCLSTCRA